MLYCNYALLCFNDLTGDVCIGMLTKRLWMVHVRQHTDVFLQKEIASSVRAAFYVNCRMLSFTHWFCIRRSLTKRDNLFKNSRILLKPVHTGKTSYHTTDWEITLEPTSQMFSCLVYATISMVLNAYWVQGDESILSFLELNTSLLIAAGFKIIEILNHII